MKAAVIVFPGSNCDRDMGVALRLAGADVSMVWHKDAALPEGTDLVAIPGGFSFGDYLRCGAIAANSPISKAIVTHAQRGGYVLGVCNGFQVLTETGLLPGALMRNAGLKFICKDVPLAVEAAASDFLRGYSEGAQISLPVAHHDGNYQADDATLDRLEGEGLVTSLSAVRVISCSGILLIFNQSEIVFKHQHYWHSKSLSPSSTLFAVTLSWHRTSALVAPGALDACAARSDSLTNQRRASPQQQQVRSARTVGAKTIKFYPLWSGFLIDIKSLTSVTKLTDA